MPIVCSPTRRLALATLLILSAAPLRAANEAATRAPLAPGSPPQAPGAPAQAPASSALLQPPAPAKPIDPALRALAEQLAAPEYAVRDEATERAKLSPQLSIDHLQQLHRATAHPEARRRLAEAIRHRWIAQQVAEWRPSPSPPRNIHPRAQAQAPAAGPRKDIHPQAQAPAAPPGAIPLDVLELQVDVLELQALLEAAPGAVPEAVQPELQELKALLEAVPGAIPEARPGAEALPGAGAEIIIIRPDGGGQMIIRPEGGGLMVQLRVNAAALDGAGDAPHGILGVLLASAPTSSLQPPHAGQASPAGSRTLPGLPAGAYLRAGDRFLAINGEPVRSTQDVRSRIVNTPSDQSVTVTLERDGRALTRRIPLGDSRVSPLIANQMTLNEPLASLWQAAFRELNAAQPGTPPQALRPTPRQLTVTE